MTHAEYLCSLDFLLSDDITAIILVMIQPVFTAKFSLNIEKNKLGAVTAGRKL